ncbi:MAG: universal stress protein [Halodesulfurarchaeum sp.]
MRYHVLMPVDRDQDRATAQVDYLLDSPMAPEDLVVRMLYVLPREDADIDDEENFEGNEAAIEAANRLEGAGATVARRMDTGSISGAILEHAEEIDADQIVMSGRKRNGVSDVLLGSTATDVIQATKRPVVMTG